MLMIFCRKKESIALLLLQKGANPNILNNKKRSPAHIAAYNNMGSALRELIKKGADINIQVYSMRYLYFCLNV